MSRSSRCRALTRDGERCSRTAADGSDYCWQHEGDDDGGGSGGGGKALKRAALVVPAALGVLEIVKRIIDIIGPFLSSEQISTLRAATQTKNVAEQWDFVLDCLATLKIRHFDKLFQNPALSAAVNQQFPGGAKGLSAVLFKRAGERKHAYSLSWLKATTKGRGKVGKRSIRRV